ncbi:hypothetical protein SELMODRAFT_425342 [Selaginella moellendorffii]|uniref:Uncharacterized protein n=1 Tax=Selaginella moellendorffii TaxID=88036 RepID=D8SST0_SELML|nr:hypothetical protein SELMODRAFT_425342 [Selaginella moellendorffii]
MGRCERESGEEGLQGDKMRKTVIYSFPLFPVLKMLLKLHQNTYGRGNRGKELPAITVTLTLSLMYSLRDFVCTGKEVNVTHTWSNNTDFPEATGLQDRFVRELIVEALFASNLFQLLSLVYAPRKWGLAGWAPSIKDGTADTGLIRIMLACGEQIVLAAVDVVRGQSESAEVLFYFRIGVCSHLQKAGK